AVTPSSPGPIEAAIAAQREEEAKFAAALSYDGNVTAVEDANLASSPAVVEPKPAEHEPAMDAHSLTDEPIVFAIEITKPLVFSVPAVSESTEQSTPVDHFYEDKPPVSPIEMTKSAIVPLLEADPHPVISNDEPKSVAGPMDGAWSANQDFVRFLYASHGEQADTIIAGVEKTTNLKRDPIAYIFIGVVTLLLIFHSIGQLLCNLIGFGYPAYVSV
ncbi:hypothetical protein PENTCL1PPCAC_13600, partial [Pristionchus entomophagus]